MDYTFIYLTFVCTLFKVVSLSQHVAIPFPNDLDGSDNKCFNHAENGTFLKHNQYNNTQNVSHKTIRFSLEKGNFFVGKMDIPKNKKVFARLPAWIKFDSKLDLLMALPIFQMTETSSYSFNMIIKTEQRIIHYCIQLSIRENQKLYNGVIQISLLQPFGKIPFFHLVHFMELVEIYFDVFEFKKSMNLDNMKSIYSYGNGNSYGGVYITIQLSCEVNLPELLTEIMQQHFLPISATNILITSNNSIQCFDNGEDYVNIIQPKKHILTGSSDTNPANRDKRSLGFFGLMNNPNLFGKQFSSPQQCASNTPPQPKSAELIITIKANRFEHVMLDNDLFIDVQDGDMSNLKLQLTWFNNNMILISDWLIFSPALKLIYAWATYETLIDQPLQGYRFSLQATDSCNMSSTMTLVFKIDNIVLHPPCHNFILIVESKMDVKTPYIHVLVDLMNLAWKNLQYNNLEQILVIDFTNVLSQKNTFSLSFADQQLQCTPCNRNEVNNRLNIMKTGPNYETFKPNFKFLGVTVDLANCNGNSPPIVLCPIPTLKISNYGIATLVLPLNTFFDAEDGFMEELDVKLVSSSRTIIMFMQLTTLYAYQMVSLQISTGNQFILQASDSSNAMASIYFNVDANHMIFQTYASFTFDFTSYYDRPRSNDHILHQFLLKMSQFLGSNVNLNDFSILSFIRSGDYPQYVKMQWTLRMFYSNNVNSQNYFMIVRNMIFNGNGISIALRTNLSPFIPQIKGSFKMNFITHTLLPTPTITEPFQTSLITKPLSASVKMTMFHPSTPTLVFPTSAIKPNVGPVANYQIGPFFATFCDFFVYPIPNNLFYDSVDGYTRNLNLTLRTYTHQEISKESWIQIDVDTQVIYGFLKVTDYVQAGSKTVLYHLVAKNSRNMETSLLFTIKLPEKIPQVFYQIQMTVSTFYDPSAPDINEQLLLLLKISTYFGEPKLSWINILSFSRNDEENVVTLAWTNCTLENSNVCPKNLVNTLSSKIVLPNGIVNSNFASSLSPQYRIKEISARVDINCPTTTSLPPTSSVIQPVKPVISTQIPVLQIFSDTYFKYRIPFNAFYDAADGYTTYLSLSLMNIDGTPLKPDSWIQFNKVAQEIYAQFYLNILQGQSMKTYTYLLIATNSRKLSAGMTLTIQVNRRLNLIGGSEVYISGTAHFSSFTNHLQVLTVLLQKYNLYMGGRYNMEISSFMKHTTGIFMATFIYHRITSNNQCDLAGIDVVQSKHIYWDGSVNPYLIQAFVPEFVISNVTMDLFGVCYLQPPLTTPNPGPTIKQQIPTLFANINNVFRYEIPINTFYDVIDGSTRQLQLAILTMNYLQVSSTYWLQLISQQTLLGVLTLEQFETTTARTFNLILRATNSAGKYIDMVLTINTLNTIIANAFHIKLQGGHLFTPSVSNTEMLASLRRNLHIYLYGMEFQQDTGIIYFRRTDSTFEYVFADSRLTPGTCFNQHYNMMMSKLYIRNRNVNPYLVLALYPSISVRSCSVEDSCLPTTSIVLTSTYIRPTPTPVIPIKPVISTQIPILQIFSDTYFKYRIPFNTFYDATDGYTTYLSLSLMNIDGTSLKPDSWIQFNKAEQEIYAHLYLNILQEQNKKTYTFLLIATNSRKLSTGMTLTIHVHRRLNLIGGSEVYISGTAHFSSFTNHLQVLTIFLQKYNLYMGGRYNMEIKSFKKHTTGIFMATFVYHSITSNNQCDLAGINVIKSKHIYWDESVNPYLIQAFVPEFVISNVTMSLFGVCYLQPPVTTPNPGPTIKQQIPTLFANINNIFRYQIPINTFYDVVDGNTRQLQLTILTMNYLQVSSTYWLQLISQQTLLGVLTLEQFGTTTARIFHLILRATNSAGKYVDMVITINTVNTIIANAFHIKLQGGHLFTPTVSNTEMLASLRRNLHIYLYGMEFQQDTGIIYFRRTDSTFEFVFADSRLTPGTCLNQHYNMMMSKLYIGNKNVNPYLVLALYPNFSVTTASVEDSCIQTTSIVPTSIYITPKPSPVLGPLVINKISILQPNIYTIFIFQIPENTFYDHNNGYTRNLKLVLLQNDRSQITTASWIQFNDQSQTITAMLNDQMVKSKTLSYILIATNSFGLSVEQKITFGLPYPLLEATHVFELSFVVTPEQNEDLKVIILVVNKLRTFIQQQSMGIRVIKFYRHQSGLLSFQWMFNTGSFCDKVKIEILRSKFFWIGDHIRSEFIQSMYPELNVGKLTFAYIGPCLIVTTSVIPASSIVPVTTQPPQLNLPPTVLKQISVQQASTCTKFVYKLHEDAFFDVEDGLTRNLNIQVKDENGNPLLPSSWLFFNQSSQEFTGVFTTVEANYRSVYIYKIIATDKGGLSVFQFLRIQLNNINNNEIMINTKGTLYVDMKRAEYLCLIHDKFNGYFTKDVTSWTGIQLDSVTVHGDLVKTVDITWSICGFHCLVGMERHLKGLMFYNDHLINNFILLIAPKMVITYSSIHGECQATSKHISSSVVVTTPSPPDTSPIIFQQIPVLTVTRCAKFHYMIPEETCYDKQDGWTTQLKVNLLFTNKTDIGHHYWLHLNPATQTIYGIIKETDIQSNVNNIFQVILQCSDSNGESASQVIQIKFISNTKPPDYKITIQSYVYSSSYKSYAEIQLLWMKKITSYLKQAEDSLQIISFHKATVLYPQIIISWYDCTITDPCSTKATQMVNKLFHLNGLNTEFSKVMIPEFVLISGKFESTKMCISKSRTSSIAMSSSIIDTNKPPVALLQQLVVNIHPSRDIQYPIPSNTFYDYEDGYTPALYLTLVTENRTPLPKNTFIKLNTTTQFIYGIVIYDRFNNENKYKIIAMDSKGRTAETNVLLRLIGSYDQPSHMFYVRSYKYLDFDFIETLVLWLKKISMYYNDKEQKVIIQTATVENNFLEIRWSNQSLIALCNIKQLEEIKTKVVIYDTIINANFIAKMAPEFLINYAMFSYNDICNMQTSTQVISSASVRQSISSRITIYPTPTPVINTSPTVTATLPFVDIEVCAPFSYRIPEYTFYDEEQGNTRSLKLSLLTFNEQVLPKSSWVQFVESTQVVYGHPRVEDMQNTKTYVNYILKATDKHGASTVTILTITFPKKPKVNFRINVTVSRFFDYSTPDLTAQLFLVSKICAYLNEPDVTNVLLVSFKRASDHVTLSWTNCTQQQQCSYVIVKKLQRQFITESGQVNEDFETALDPYYNVYDISFDISKDCVQESSTTLSPSPSSKFIMTSTAPITTILSTSSIVLTTNRPPIINYTIPPIELKICQSFAYKIPTNVFLDEDGMTSELDLTVLYMNGTKLRHTSWIQFNPRLQIIYGMIKTKDIDVQPSNGYNFLLKATDSAFLSTATIVPFKYLSDSNPIGFFVRMKIRCTYISSYPYVNDLFQIINIISVYFKDTTPNTIKSIDLQTSTTDLNIIYFTWTNCSLDFTNSCPNKEVSSMITKIFDPTDKVRQALKSAFTPQYTLEDVEISRQPPCEISTTTTPSPNGPVINQYIPATSIKKCSYFHYKIPENTFYDAQDGTTSSLKLTLKFINDSNIPKRYWLQFDSSEKTISGYPQKIKTLQPNGYLFKLTAIDNDDNSVFLNIRINVVEGKDPILQNITLNLAMNFELGITNMAIQNLLVERIVNFYNSNNTEYVQVLTFNREAMFISLTWTNCTTRGTTCDKDLLKHIQDRIMDINGKCRTQFSFVFLPEFIVRNLIISNHYTCNMTLSSSVIAPTSSLSYIPQSSKVPIPNSVFPLKNITLDLSFCGSLQYTVDRNAFYDSFNQNKGPLIYSILYTDKLPVDCASWLQIKNNQMHAMAIHSTSNLPRKYLLKARNELGSYAMANVKLELLVPEPNVTYKVALSFLSSFNSTICDADVLHVLLDRISSYFADSSDKNITTLYFSRGDRSTRSYIMWGNCSLRTDVCDFKKINKISEMLFESNSSKPHANLVKHLEPDFYNLSVLDEKIGPCSKNQLLAVGKEPDVICASPCGEFKYKIPDDTFVDPEDGNTPNLIVEVTHINLAPLTKRDWVYFNLTTKTLHGMVTEHVKQNQPLQGYRYLMSAYDTQGAAAQAVLNIKVCEDLPSFDSSITLEFQCSGNITSVIEEVILILRSISTKYLDGTLDSVFLVEFTGFDDNRILFTWANCTSGDVVFDIGDLAGSFSSRCSSLNETKNDNKDYPPTTNITSIRLKPSYCKDNVYTLPAHAFYDKEGIENLDIILTYQNGSRIVSSDWIGFVKSNLKLYMVITNMTITEVVYKYYFVASDSRNQSAKIPLYIELFGSFPEVNYLITSEYKSYYNAPIAAKIHTFLEKWKSFFNSNDTLLITKYSSYDNNTIRLEYGNCSLPTHICAYDDIDANMRQLQISDSSINPDLFTYLFPECILEKVETKKLGTCLTPPNTPPNATKPLQIIHVPNCGYLKYQIPEDMFLDKEDGYTRNLTLKMLTNKTCWFEFDEENQIIYIMATKEALAKQPTNGYLMNITAVDSGSLSTNITLRIILETYPLSSFEIVFLFEITSKLQASCLHEKILILDKLNNHFNSSQAFAIKSALKGVDNIFIEVVSINCSLRYSPCDYITIDTMLSRLEDSSGSINSDFRKQTLPELFARYISKRRDKPCLESSNTAPKQNASLKLPNITLCDHIHFKLPTNLVYDVEDGDIFNMKTQLINATSGFEIGNTSWIYLKDSTKDLLITASTETSLHQPDNGYGFLLKVTDSRAESVDIEFNIKIEEPPILQTFTVKDHLMMNPTQVLTEFLIDWKNKTEGEISSEIQIISSKIIPGNKLDVNWTLCQTESKCNFKVLQDIDTSVNNDSSRIITKFELCLHEKRFPPNGTNNSTITIYPCRELLYKLPETLFTDDFDGTTSNLTVDLIQVYPNEVVTTLAYNRTNQTIYGIPLTDFFYQYGYLEYDVKATDSDNMEAVIKLRFIIDTSNRPQYNIKIDALFYDTEGTDFTFLDSFYKKTTDYLQLQEQGIFVSNITFKKTGSIKQYITNFTPCTLLTSECKTDELERINNLLFANSQPNFNYRSILLNEIVVRDITITKIRECEKSPPEVGIPIGTLKTKICKRLDYQIPENAFLDLEDGLSTNLSVKLENIDKYLDWVTFDIVKQLLDVKATITELLLMPLNGFNLIFKATDSDENTVSQNVSLIIENKVDDFNFFVVLKLKFLTYTFENIYKLKEYIETRVKSLLINRITSITLINLNNITIDGIFFATFYDCNLNPEICDLFENEKFYRSFVDLNDNFEPQIEQGFLPEFQLLEVAKVEQNNCNNINIEPPYSTTTVPVLNLTLCKQLQHRLPEKLFMDRQDGQIKKSSVRFCTLDGQPVRIDSPVRYDQNAQVIYAYITQKQLQNYQSNQLIYLLKATDSDNNTADLSIYVNIPQLQTNSYIVNISATTVIDYTSPDLDVILNFLNRMYTYFQDNLQNSITIIDFQRSRTPKQRIVIEWQNCTISNGCEKDKISYIENRIYDNRNRNLYIEALGRNAGFLDVVTTSDTNVICGKNNISIYLDYCGDFSYSLPSDAFVSTSNVILRYESGMTVPVSYWIQYNKTKDALYGFPDEEALLKIKTILILTSTEDNSNIYVYVYSNVTLGTNTSSTVVSNEIRIYATCTVSDNSDAKPWLDDTIEILNSFATTMNISSEDIHLKSVQRLSNNATKTISINTCKNINLTVVEKVISERTKQCTIIDIAIITPPVNPETPEVINSIPTLTVTCGVPLLYQIPEETFLDYQDGTTSNLLLTLVDQRQNIVKKQYVQLESNQLIFFVSIENCFKIVTDESLYIKATDKDGNYALDSFNLREIRETVSCCMYISTILNKEYNKTVNNNQYIYNYYETLKKYYNDTSDNLRLVSISNSSNNAFTNILYTNKTFTNRTCMKNTTDAITRTLFSESGDINTNFTTYFQSYGIQDVSVITNPLCNDTNATVPIVIVPPPSVGSFTASDDWLVYLIPLFLLAFMLLAACICFYCCRYCYKSCCGSGKTGKKQYFIEDFENPEDTIDSGVAAAPNAAPLASGYSAIPIEETSGESELDEKDDPGQSWDVAPQSGGVAAAPRDQPSAPSSRSQSIIAPMAVCNQEDGRRFSEMFQSVETRSSKTESKSVALQDIYAKPIKVSKKRQEINQRNRLDVSGPVTTSYISPSYDATVRQKHQRNTSRQVSNFKHENIEQRIANRGVLRLPAIPKGPPPPYSPPRRTRIIRQNVIPEYYGQYVRHNRQEVDHDISFDRVSRGSNKRTIIVKRPHKRKNIISLPSFKKYKKNKQKRRSSVQVVHVPIETSSTSDLSVATSSLTRYDSDSSVEVQAVLRGKGSALKKILRKSPISYKSQKRKRKQEEKYKVTVIKSPTLIKKRKIRRRLPSLDESQIEIIRRRKSTDNQHQPFSYKYTKPFLYDYLPVKRNGGREFKETVKIERKPIIRKQMIERNKKRPTLDELLDSIDLNNTEVRGKRRKVPLSKRYRVEQNSSSDFE